MIEIPKLNDYFSSETISVITQLAKLIEQANKQKFVSLSNRLIDNENILEKEDFKTLFGQLATHLYSNNKSDYLHELNFYKNEEMGSLNFINPIDLEVLYNNLQVKYSEVYAQLHSPLYKRGIDDGFGRTLYEIILEYGYFYFEFPRLQKIELNQEIIDSLVDKVLASVYLFKDVLMDTNYKPNCKYTQAMFNEYYELRRNRYNEYDAAFEILEKYFGKSAITNHQVSVEAFFRLARDRNK